MDKAFVFVSYARKNQETVRHIIEMLEQSGVKTYVDFRDIPPGSVFAEEIVNAIESSLCCLLMYTEDSNLSGYVLNEMNSAINHNRPIIPLRLDRTTPSKALEFYIGKNNWIDYCGEITIAALVKAIQSIRDEQKKGNSITYPGPIVLNHEQLYELGYTTEKIVTETIEIDYITLGEAPKEFTLNDEIEGNLEDWFSYVRSYPETSAMLVVQDRIAGYYQIELINEENYQTVISGKSMINSCMEEFYGFGGEYYCYIAIMPILPKYETNSNYILLLNHLFARIVSMYENDISIAKFGISVYAPLLEKIVQTLGFTCVGTNPAGGKIFELTKETVRNSSIFRRKYSSFCDAFGGKND